MFRHGWSYQRKHFLGVEPVFTQENNLVCLKIFVRTYRLCSESCLYFHFVSFILPSCTLFYLSRSYFKPFPFSYPVGRVCLTVAHQTKGLRFKPPRPAGLKGKRKDFFLPRFSSSLILFTLSGEGSDPKYYAVLSLHYSWDTCNRALLFSYTKQRSLSFLNPMIRKIWVPSPIGDGLELGGPMYKLCTWKNKWPDEEFLRNSSSTFNLHQSVPSFFFLLFLLTQPVFIYLL